jgi:hypothetical protein
MTELQTLPDAPRYESLIKAGAQEASFDIALYRPVPRQQFDVGTIFLRQPSGVITTFVGPPYAMVFFVIT